MDQLHEKAVRDEHGKKIGKMKKTHDKNNWPWKGKSLASGEYYFGSKKGIRKALQGDALAMPMRESAIQAFIKKYIYDNKNKPDKNGITPKQMKKWQLQQKQMAQGVREAARWPAPNTRWRHELDIQSGKRKPVSWNPPEVQAKAAKFKKEQKQFDSAKREIKRLKANNEETVNPGRPLAEIIGHRGEYIAPRYRMYQNPDKTVSVHRREMDLKGTKSIGTGKDEKEAKHIAKADFAKDWKSFPGKIKLKGPKGSKIKMFEGK
jgi:hypothetical protein